MSTNAFVINVTDLADKKEGVQASYVYYDGAERLKNILEEHFVGKPEKMANLMSSGYTTAINAEGVIERKRTEPQINLNDRVFMGMVFDDFVEAIYIHVVRNNTVQMFLLKDKNHKEILDAIFEG